MKPPGPSAAAVEEGLRARAGAVRDEAIRTLRPEDLPAPPQAAARIVQACSDPEVSARALSRIVASDLVLTAELLRTVNSAFFGKREVRSAAQAVTVLGNRALRNLALCLAVRDALRPDAIPGFDMLEYWEDALRRAVGAKLLATRIGLDADEAFTIGLLQDFGMLALLYGMPHHAGRWDELRRTLPEDRRAKEIELFGITHDKVGLMLAKAWALPSALAMPMACHHAHDAPGIPEPLRAACKVAMCADLVAAVHSAEDKKSAIDRCRAVIAAALSLTPDQVDAVLEAVPAGVEEAAQSLGLRMPVQPRMEEVHRAANRHLAAMNKSYQELTWELERALAEKELLMAKLREANASLEQLAHYDALTGLVNRRRFQEVVAAEISRHSRNGFSMSLVVLDLDHFKRVNDTYGHPFGDAVLETVANVLRATLRTADTKARIGGEEMCLILPETGRNAAQDAVERIRQAIAATELSAPVGKVKVTASFGGSTWSGAANSPDAVASVARRLMEAADAALYESKRAGRDRVSWKPITETPTHY